MKDALLAVKCVRLHAMKANDSRLSCAPHRHRNRFRLREAGEYRSIIVNMMGGGGHVRRRENVAKSPHVARRTSHVIASRTSHVARHTSHVARRSSHVARRTSHSV